MDKIKDFRTGFSQGIAERILKGLLVSGFENDADIERTLDGQESAVRGTIFKALAEYDETREEIRRGSADSRENLLADYTLTLAALVRLKYGNRDPDIYALVEKAIALAGEK